MKLILIAAALALTACPSSRVALQLDAMDEPAFAAYQERVERRTALLARAVLEEGDVTQEKLLEIAGWFRAGLLETITENVTGYRALAVDLALDRFEERLGGDLVSPRARALLNAVADALEGVAQ